MQFNLEKQSTEAQRSLGRYKFREVLVGTCEEMEQIETYNRAAGGVSVRLNATNHRQSIFVVLLNR